MELVLAILGNEVVMNILVIGMGAAVTWIAGKFGAGAIKQQKITQAREITKAAVSSLHQEAARLKAQYNGKLPIEEQERLSKRAMSVAQDIGVQYGIDIAKLVGPDVFKLFVVEGVKELKGILIPKKKKLPENIKALLPIVALCLLAGCISLPDGWETADPNFVMVVSEACEIHEIEHLDIPDLECIRTSGELLAAHYMTCRARGLDKDESARLAINEAKRYIKTNFKELLNNRSIEEFLRDEFHLDTIISDAEIWLGMIIQSLSGNATNS